jgi:hypothetical protein
LEIDWERRSTFAIAPDLSVGVPAMAEGPHIAKAWVAAPNAPSATATSLSSVQVAFFVRAPSPAEDAHTAEGGKEASSTGVEGDEEDSSELSRWARTMMSLLVQHPPPHFVFRSRAALFVEVRVTDKEMQLSLEEA